MLKNKEQIEKKLKLLKKKVDIYNNPKLYKDADAVLKKEYDKLLEKYWYQYLMLRWVLGR